MQDDDLKLHIAQVLQKAKHAPPELARLVLRAGIFLVVSKIEQKAKDKLIWRLNSFAFTMGFRSQVWDKIITIARNKHTEYTNEQNAKNAHK